MSFSPASLALIARDERIANRRTTEQGIVHHARQALIAYRNLDHWPQNEAKAALEYSMAQLGCLLDVSA